MKRLVPFALILVLCNSPCFGKDVASNVAAQHALAKACPLFVRAVESDGTLAPYAFIRPEHVRSMSPTAPLYMGEIAIWVELDDVGAKRMLQLTTSHVGSKLAIFCGKKELNRPRILAPFSSGFRVHITDHAPNNSFKPKPLRGSA